MDVTLNYFWQWSSSPGALKNVEYHFPTITSKSTLTWNYSTCLDPIYRSKNYLIIYFTWNRSTAYKMINIKLNYHYQIAMLETI